jgi:hypothetical protein
LVGHLSWRSGTHGLRNEMHIRLEWLSRLIQRSRLFLVRNQEYLSLMEQKGLEGGSQATLLMGSISLRIPWEGHAPVMMGWKREDGFTQQLIKMAGYQACSADFSSSLLSCHQWCLTWRTHTDLIAGSIQPVGYQINTCITAFPMDSGRMGAEMWPQRRK